MRKVKEDKFKRLNEKEKRHVLPISGTKCLSIFVVVALAPFYVHASDYYYPYTHYLCIPELNYMSIEGLHLPINAGEEELFVDSDRVKHEHDVYNIVKKDVGQLESEPGEIVGQIKYTTDYNTLFDNYGLIHGNDDRTRSCKLASGKEVKVKIAYNHGTDQVGDIIDAYRFANVTLWEDGEMISYVRFFNPKRSVTHHYKKVIYKFNQNTQERYLEVSGYDYTKKYYFSIVLPNGIKMPEDYLDGQIEKLTNNNKD